MAMLSPFSWPSTGHQLMHGSTWDGIGHYGTPALPWPLGKHTTTSFMSYKITYLIQNKRSATKLQQQFYSLPGSLPAIIFSTSSPNHTSLCHWYCLCGVPFYYAPLTGAHCTHP